MNSEHFYIDGAWVASDGGRSHQVIDPSTEQPVRAVKVAELLAVALRIAPPGVHVAAPETVWEAAQGPVEAVARRWLG